MKKTTMVLCLSLVMLALGTVVQAADFTLTGNQHLNVTTGYSSGRLWDYSTADIMEDGYCAGASVYDEAMLNFFGGWVGGNVNAYGSSTVNMYSGSAESLLAYHTSTVNISTSGGCVYLRAYDTSTVNIYGGIVAGYLYAYGTSIVNISGGIVGRDFGDSELYAYTSTINISGGDIHRIRAKGASVLNVSGGSMVGLSIYNNSNVDISGGQINQLFATDLTTVNVSGGSIGYGLNACGDSTIIFDGYDFELGNGLSWDIDGKTILGTGILTGKWFDGTNWAITIIENQEAATIMAIPEPTTMLLFGLGGLVLRCRHCG